MKILIAGNWRWLQYEKAFAEALLSLGYEIVPFAFHDFFEGPLGYYHRVIPFPGPVLWKLNRSLLTVVHDNNPELVLVWRGTHVLPTTVRLIKATGARIVSYNNDDPFGPMVHSKAPLHHRFLWMWYLRSLKYFDVSFFYRPVNVQEAVNYGSKNVHLLKPYFIPAHDKPVELTEAEKQRFTCDIVYVGHYEPDGRVEYIRALTNAGLHVRLFGGGYWTKKTLGDLSSYFDDVAPVHGEDYAKALCGAKMCLAFLSKINRDTYTRRCFEIPACGRLLICERTDDMKEMFIENKEAIFFSSKEELVEKTVWLLKHPDEINRIAEAGRKRVWADGHDVVNRARQFINIVSNYSMHIYEKEVQSVCVEATKPCSEQGESIER